MAYTGLGSVTSANAQSLCDASNPNSPLNDPATAQRAFADCSTLYGGVSLLIAGKGKVANPFGLTPIPVQGPPVVAGKVNALSVPFDSNTGGLTLQSLIPIGAQSTQSSLGLPSWLASLLGKNPAAPGSTPFPLWLALLLLGVAVFVGYEVLENVV